VLSRIKDSKKAVIVGISPGSKGEKVDTLYKKVCELGYSPEAFEDFEEMLDKVKPDVAVINSYFCDHAKIVLKTLQRKIHVFVEKPIATTLEDLELVKQAYRGAGVSLTAMFGIRYKPWFLTASKAIKSGEIGMHRLLSAQKSYRLGSRSDNYKKRELYGGTIPWVGSHAIDWVYWFSGERFQSVFATDSRLYNKNHGELELNAQCQFTLTNEVMASVSIDYLRPSKAPSHDDDRIRVAGTEGVIEVRGQKVYLINNKESGIQELPLVEEGEIFEDFLKEVAGEGKCMVSAEDSIYITEICLKTRQAADEKRVIYFE
jgi:predicted dehydrogenase